MDENEIIKRIEKANAEYLAEFENDPRKAYMNVPVYHPAFLRLKAKLKAIEEENAKPEG